MSTKKQVFKEGDKVFCILYGHGTILSIDPFDSYPIVVLFESGTEEVYTINGCYDNNTTATLSFNEYTLKGFSQDRPEVLPNKGDIVWVRNEPPGNWAIGHFYEKRDDYYYISNYVGEKEWARRGLEITTKNPYENREA